MFLKTEVGKSSSIDEFPIVFECLPSFRSCHNPPQQRMVGGAKGIVAAPSSGIRSGHELARNFTDSQTTEPSGRRGRVSLPDFLVFTKVGVG